MTLFLSQTLTSPGCVLKTISTSLCIGKTSAKPEQAFFFHYCHTEFLSYPHACWTTAMFIRGKPGNISPLQIIIFLFQGKKLEYLWWEGHNESPRLANWYVDIMQKTPSEHSQNAFFDFTPEYGYHGCILQAVILILQVTITIFSNSTHACALNIWYSKRGNLNLEILLHIVINISLQISSFVYFGTVKSWRRRHFCVLPYSHHNQCICGAYTAAGSSRRHREYIDKHASGTHSKCYRLRTHWLLSELGLSVLYQPL